MLKRVMTLLGAWLVACGCMVAVAAPAGAQSGPPMPTSTNGHTPQIFATGVATPTSFAFGGGTVFEGDNGPESGGSAPGGVFVLPGGGAKAIRVAGSPAVVFGLVWHDKTLYVSALNKILAWSGWNAKTMTFAKKKVIYTAPKGFSGFNGLAFGPDGRLYAGVDVGENNDHGPVTKKTPYLYDILSFAADGKGGPTVYATGLRQPWQLAFSAHSGSPYVTVLGQDKAAKNPPDYIVHVSKGDNYGFPQCNRTKGSVCKGFTKPFQLLAPHSDPGGIAITGGRIYFSEFGFATVPPQVVSIPLKGGKPTTLLAFGKIPVIGMNISHGWLYAGALDGIVYRVHL